jgi:hypothetical protein
MNIYNKLCMQNAIGSLLQGCIHNMNKSTKTIVCMPCDKIRIY